MAKELARYLIERAVPKRIPSTAQLRAVRAALITRRTCSGPCRQVQQQCVSTTSRMCPTCETTTHFWERHAADHGHSWPTTTTSPKETFR